MWALLTTTVAAAFADSINPIAIAQQMVLQSAIRKKWHIWGFIIGIAITNFIFGTVVYFGFSDFIRSTYQYLSIRFPGFLAWISLVIGVILLMFCIYNFYKKRIKNKKEELVKKEDQPTNNHVNNPGFWKLFSLGVVSCALELTSALPYIAYITILIQADLSTIGVISLLIFYNILFSWPLIILYLASVYYERYFNRIYVRLIVLMNIIIHYILPAALIISSIGLILFGTAKIM